MTINWADVINIEGKLFRKEQILKYEIDGEVNFISDDNGKIIEVRKTPKTKILRIETLYLDDIFKVVRAYNPEKDGEGLKCSICKEAQTNNGYFVKKIKSLDEKDLLFIGYFCWKSDLRPKL